MNVDEEYRKNGFDLLRYIAALSVMLLHYSSYTMILSDNLPEKASAVMSEIRHTALLFPGVVMLFAMSGFLVSASFERAKTRKEFFLRRVLRIYPELWICTLINLAVVCIMVSELLDRGIILWLVTQIFGIAYTPACLKTLPTGSINGALWTVFTEVQLYIVLGIVYPFLQKMKEKHWAALLAVLAALNLVCAAAARETGGIAAKLIERIFVPYALWFFIGVFCFQRRQKMISVLKKAFLPLVIIYLIIESVNIQIPGYYADIVTGVMVPFMVIGCGYCLPKICLKPDLSYGMFLYHWIILNIITYLDLMNRLPWYAGLLLFIIGTMIVAVISWVLNFYCDNIWKKRKR
ncbi:MAG: acyltransferase [Lachnospiraceae bacterium]|nr:acyltransferase [Lachnospiraceae bacterium]